MSDIRYRNFTTVHHSGLTPIIWTARGSPSNNISALPFTKNDSVLEFTFNVGSSKYISGQGSYLAFDLETNLTGDAERRLNFLKLNRGPCSLFQSFELFSRDHILLDSCHDPELIDQLCLVKAQEKQRSGLYTLNQPGDHLCRRYLLPLNHILGFFNPNELIAPQILDGCILRLTPKTFLADSVTRLESLTLNDPSFTGQFDTFTADVVSETNAVARTFIPGDLHSVLRGGLVENVLVFVNDTVETEVRISQPTLVIDTYQLAIESQQMAEEYYQTNGFEYNFNSFDIYQRRLVATQAEFAVPRSIGALLRVYVKKVKEYVNDKTRAHYGHLMSRLINHTESWDSLTNSYLPRTARSPWGLTSAQIRVGNLLYPDVPVTRPEDALFQYIHAHSIYGESSLTQKQQEKFAASFSSLDAVGFSLANEIHMPGDTQGGFDQEATRTNFGNDVVVRLGIPDVNPFPLTMLTGRSPEHGEVAYSAIVVLEVAKRVTFRQDAAVVFY